MIYIIYVHIFHLCTSPSYNIVRGKKKNPISYGPAFLKKKKKLLVYILENMTIVQNTCVVSLI